MVLALGSLAGAAALGITAAVPAAASQSCSVDASSPYAQAVLGDGPVDYYPLDQSSGQPLCDASGRADDGTFAGSGLTFGIPGPIQGSSDDAVGADGQADVATSNGDSGVVGPHDLTLEGWFRTTTQQDQMVVSLGLGGTQHGNAGIGVWVTGGVTVRWDTYGGSAGLSPRRVDPYDGRWHFVAGTYDARSQAVTLYLDGTSLGTVSMPTDPTASPVRIGYWTDTVYNQPFNGALAQVAVFDSALSAAQIATQWRIGDGTADVSSLASSLPTPAQAFARAGAVAASVAVAAGGTLFITFPAQLFNLTFQENYDVIVGWFRRRRWLGLRRRPGGASPLSPGATPAGEGGRAPTATSAAGWVNWRAELPRFATVVVVGAVLGALLDPHFGANTRTGELIVAIALATASSVLVAGYVADRYHRRSGEAVVKHLHALPWGLLIALVGVVVSRLTSFEPGYLYGVVCAVVFERHLRRDEAGHVAALSVLSVLCVSVVAWLLWVPVDQAAGGSSLVPLVVLDDFLAAVFVGGIVGTTVGMLPLRFLPGGTIKEWSTGAWVALFGFSLFALVDFVVRSPGARSVNHSPFVLTVILFVVFGGLSVGVREYFARRWRREHHVEVHGFGAHLRDLFVARTAEEGEEFVVTAGHLAVEEEETGDDQGPATQPPPSDGRR